MISHFDLVIGQVVSEAEVSPSTVPSSGTKPASLIADIEQHIAQAPAIDRQKIEAIKKKLANNEYRFKPEQIAEKILRLEQDLFY